MRLPFTLRGLFDAGRILALLGLLAVQAPGDAAEDQFQFATGLLIKNEHQLAADEFRALLAAHPGFPSADVAWYRLGESLRALGDARGAREAYGRVVEGHPASERLPQALFHFAQLGAAERPRDAAAHYARIADTWPEHALAEAARYWQAEALFQAEAWREAAAVYAAVATQWPDGQHAAHARYSLGWAWSRAADHEAAQTAFRAFLAAHPDHELATECRIKLAESLQQLGRHAEAGKVYAQVTAAGGALAGDAAIGQAWALYRQGEYPAAAAAFSAAAERLGADPRAAVCRFNAGNAHVEARDFAAAAGAFGRMVADHAGHELRPAALYWQGYSLVQLGRHAEAAALLEPLAGADAPPERRAEIRYALAHAKRGTGDARAAAEWFARVEREDPKHALAVDAAYGRMLALDAAGDLPGAVEAGEALLRAHKEGDVVRAARFALGEYRFRQGQHAAALALFDRVLADTPPATLVADAVYKRGWCRLHLQEPAQAREDFLRVVRDHPESPLAVEAVLLAGRAAEEAGDAAGAAGHYRTCVERWPQAPEARRASLALALLDLGAGRHAEALQRAESFLSAHAADPLVPFAHLYRGEALLETGRAAEALEAYGRVPADTDGAGADAAYGAAWAQRKLGRHAEAATAFERVARLKTSRAPDAAFWRCRSLEDAGQPAEAAAGYEAFLAGHAGSPLADEAAYRRALCLQQAGQGEAARVAAAAYVRDRPAGAFADHARYDLAWLELGAGRTNEAVAGLEALLRDRPAGALAADAQFRLGEVAYDRADYARAAGHYEAALAAPGAARLADMALYKLGWSHERGGRADAGLEAFARLVRDHAGSTLAEEARVRQGRLLAAAGRHGEARAVLEPVRDDAWRPAAWLQVAESWRAEGRHAEALEAYGRLVKTFPGHALLPQAQLGQGHAFRAVGAWEDAHAAYDAVVAATDTIDAAQALLGKGHVWLAQGDTTNAAKAFLRVEIVYGYEEPKAEALAMLARTWERAGDAEKAGRYRAELRTRYPQSAFAKE